jgi:hypothetical protein
MDENLKQEALQLARLLGHGDLELGVKRILQGTHWENNFQHLLGVLELHGPIFFMFSGVPDAHRVTRSYQEYRNLYKQISHFLSSDEKEILRKALDGEPIALIELVSQCPEYLLIQEITNHVITFLREAKEADRGHIQEYQALLQKLIPPRPGGKRPLVKEDIKSAFIVLYETHQDQPRKRGEPGAAEFARKRIADVLGLPVSAVFECTKDILPQGAPPKSH